MSQRPLVIVGAGPAGMSAAIAAADHGVHPVIIDENPRIGGQIYRQPPAGFREFSSAAHPVKERPGSELIQEFERRLDRIDLLTGATVWGLFPPRQVMLIRDGRTETIDAGHLILALGAYEYVPPFPGWTLPGVMTPGAAQTMVKAMGVLPGRRALVAGTGPFLLVVAEQLQGAGVEVVGVVEMSRRWQAVRSLLGLLAAPRLLVDGMRYLRRLKRAGIAVLWGQMVIEAKGDTVLKEVAVTPCDGHGRPDHSAVQRLDVDLLCVGYGFVPRVQLAQLAGCKVSFDDVQGGWVPERNEEFETTAGSVWVAGDGGGIGGALAAQVEGRLAGLAVARRLQAIEAKRYERERRPLQRKLVRLRRFQAALHALYPIRPGLAELATPETVVCRCEELARAEVETGIDAGGSTLPTLKVMTRLGMGPCQGMMCWPAMARLIAARTGKSVEEVGPLSPRPPIVPVGLASFAEEDAGKLPTNPGRGGRSLEKAP